MLLPLIDDVEAVRVDEVEDVRFEDVDPVRSGNEELLDVDADLSPMSKFSNEPTNKLTINKRDKI